MRSRVGKLGNATIEFTLVGIPLLCVLISTFEMARGMWIYHTLAYAVKEGARYAIVRGQNSPNQITLNTLCNYIVQQGPGLIPHDLSLTFHSATQTDITSLADACSTTTTWPPGGLDGTGNPIIDNEPGEQIIISATFPFKSSIILFWPGAKEPKGGTQFPAFTFPAQASEVMQF